ncbi:forkhead-associated domain-containing protein 1 [Rhinatrema bivittatum]|uniref:forkhead-associated domain-containing protein 1 n=1 Tax=Rhinatrema bivittatum TaxID=194408 RepID=UPI001126EEE1|nr:forkhead-associated domain-containing protein 1 [Rhinatrema bivittatum]
MKGFLKCSESVFVLKSRVTTIGRNGDSDLILKSADIEEHHARIELNELENCFVLHDLNSLHGTFVNDCHIQNAAVKLSPGDVLRFGSSGIAYELLLENTSQMFCPPVKRRTAWPGELQLLYETRLHSSPLTTSQLPFLQSQPSPVNLGNWIHGANGTMPHPPHRSRSAGAGNRKMALAFSADPIKKPLTLRQGNSLMLGNGASLTLDSLLQEKDQMLKMDSEAHRLLALETESRCKDVVIANLRERVSVLMQQMAQAGPTKSDMELVEKLLALDQEVIAKTEEIEDLKGQISSLQKGSSQVLCHSLSVRDCEISNLKNEGDKLRKSLSVTSGLVTTLQKEATAKEQQIVQMKLEAETLKKENRERDSQLAALSVKVNRIREEKRDDTEFKKDLLASRNCIKEMDLRIKELEEDIHTARKEQEKLQNALTEKNKVEEKLNQESERKSLQLQEMGRRERLIKSQTESFRNQVIHIIFSPEEMDEAVSDQQVSEKLKLFLEERMQFSEKVRALQDDSNQELLKKVLEECQASLVLSCSTHDLKREISAIQDLCVDPSVLWIQKVAVEILTSIVSRQQEAELLLQDIGIDTSSPKEMPLYIKSLQEMHQQSVSKSEELQMQLIELQTQQPSLIQEKLDELEAKHEKQLQDKMQQFCIVKEEEHKKLLDEAIAKEKNKAVEKEKKKVEELECMMQQSMELNLKETEALNTHLTEALKNMEEARTQEALLKEQLSVRDKQLQAETQRAENKAEKQRQQELAAYKEQIKQHAQTILALENRILEVTEQQQSLEQENADLWESLKAAQEEIDQTEPLSSKVPSECYSIENTSTFLKKELADAQGEILSQHALIVRLKRELAEVNVRMSDMAGELREKEKIELEKNQTLIKNQKAELSMLREKLAEVSILAEQKNSELRTATENLRQAHKNVERQQNLIKEKDRQLETLQQEIACLRPINSQQNENSKKKEETGVLHLAEQGARCRGLRHEEIIQNQKDALSELRIRLKELEKAYPSKIPDQVSPPFRSLKKEMLEIKPQKLLLNKEHQLSSIQSDTQTKMSETYKKSEMSEAAVERTARLEMSEALDLSEEMYFSLINVLGSLMSIKELSGVQTLKHLAQEEREKACKQRQKDIQMLSNRISQLKNQLKRKEDLLVEYDTDLQELRQSKLAMKMQQLDIKELETEIHRHEEENALLREALNRTELQMKQEKRLNRFAKHQKGLLDQLETCQPTAPSSEPEDRLGKVAFKEKVLQEKLKKREYEIETLKKQLEGIATT